MKLNPKTAAKQWLRKIENITAKNQVMKTVDNSNSPGIFDKWGSGGRIIRNARKINDKSLDYMVKITKPTKDTKVFLLIYNFVNTNKFTNGSLIN